MVPVGYGDPAIPVLASEASGEHTAVRGPLEEPPGPAAYLGPMSAIDRVRKAVSLVRRPRQALEQVRQGAGPWISFRASYRAVSVEGERAHVAWREQRYEDGRLESASFEGTVETSALRELLGGLLDRLPGRRER